MSEGIIQVERQNGICTVTMNRPHLMNAVNLNSMQEFESALDEIDKDNDIKIVIVTGAGDNFSSGADMHLLDSIGSAPEALKFMQTLRKMIVKIRELPQPIISKVRGVAYGVGSNIALASDFVMAAHDARFCEVFVNIGVILDGGGTYFLPRLVGLPKAREIALLGEEFDGREAARIGLIYKSVSNQNLDNEVDLLAQKLSEKSPAALALIKMGLEKSLDMNLSDVLEWEASHQAVMLRSNEHKAAVSSFLKTHGKEW